MFYFGVRVEASREIFSSRFRHLDDRAAGLDDGDESPGPRLAALGSESAAIVRRLEGFGNPFETLSRQPEAGERDFRCLESIYNRPEQREKSFHHESN